MKTCQRKSGHYTSVTFKNINFMLVATLILQPYTRNAFISFSSDVLWVTRREQIGIFEHAVSSNLSALVLGDLFKGSICFGRDEETQQQPHAPSFLFFSPQDQTQICKICSTVTWVHRSGSIFRERRLPPLLHLKFFFFFIISNRTGTCSDMEK